MSLSLTVCSLSMLSYKSCRLKLLKWTVSSQTTNPIRKPCETFKRRHKAASNRVVSPRRSRRKIQLPDMAASVWQGKLLTFRCATHRENSK
jgi:hypothetical protein